LENVKQHARPLTRCRFKPWKLLAFTCLNLSSPKANCMKLCREWMTSLFYAQMAGRRPMLFIRNCCNDLSSLSLASFSFSTGQNSHIQITSWNSLHWMQKWLQRKLHSRCAIVENRMFLKFLLSHQTKIVLT
jgi:hypothetical protein